MNYFIENKNRSAVVEPYLDEVRGGWICLVYENQTVKGSKFFRERDDAIECAVEWSQKVGDV